MKIETVKTSRERYYKFLHDITIVNFIHEDGEETFKIKLTYKYRFLWGLININSSSYDSYPVSTGREDGYNTYHEFKDIYEAYDHIVRNYHKYDKPVTKNFNLLMKSNKYDIVDINWDMKGMLLADFYEPNIKFQIKIPEYWRLNVQHKPKAGETITSFFDDKYLVRHE